MIVLKLLVCALAAFGAYIIGVLVTEWYRGGEGW